MFQQYVLCVSCHIEFSHMATWQKPNVMMSWMFHLTHSLYLHPLHLILPLLPCNKLIHWGKHWLMSIYWWWWVSTVANLGNWGCTSCGCVCVFFTKLQSSPPVARWWKAFNLKQQQEVFGLHSLTDLITAPIARQMHKSRSMIVGRDFVGKHWTGWNLWMWF